MPMEEETNRIFAIKTTSKQERTVADNIKKAIDSGATDVRVSSIIVPDELKGYVLVETPRAWRGSSSWPRKCPCAHSGEGRDPARGGSPFPGPNRW